MRILIFHGYLLRGTGSNVYNANLAQTLARLGHRVQLLCQDRRAGELPWVDAVGEAAPGERGSVSVHVPDIGGLLPVYVADRYEGFRVKTFPELSEAELERYLDANVAAVREAVGLAGGVDAALANHLVMGPVILARAGLRYAVKVHGSDLEYTVKPHPRFLPYARQGIATAAGVLTGSRHTAESLWGAIGDPGLPARTRLGPPGVDVERFAPRPPGEAERRLRALAGRMAASAAGAAGAEFGADPAAAAAALRRFAEAPGPRVLYVGKLIAAKGVDLLLAAWPEVLAAHPGARLLVVGFGEQRPELERLAAELAPPGTVAFAGRLEHAELAELMPAAGALVFPSTFPEAFGMVAVEAAACGVLPIAAGHSGLREVSRALAAAVPPEAAPLCSFPLGEGAPAQIAERLKRWLALDPGLRAATAEALAAEARRRWSWEGAARGVIAAAQGRLDELPPVPSE